MRAKIPCESALSFTPNTGTRTAASQPGGKIVHVWAVEHDWDAADLKSNMFEMEWPPRSGRRQMFPELDRAVWFEIEEARAKILKGQAVFLDRLLAAIADG